MGKYEEQDYGGGVGDSDPWMEMCEKLCGMVFCGCAFQQGGVYICDMACGSFGATSGSGEVEGDEEEFLRALLKYIGEDMNKFWDRRGPPMNISRWIKNVNRASLRGVLMEVLIRLNEET